MDTLRKLLSLTLGLGSVWREPIGAERAEEDLRMMMEMKKKEKKKMWKMAPSPPLLFP